jgi:hypothetical protein
MAITSQTLQALLTELSDLQPTTDPAALATESRDYFLV